MKKDKLEVLEFNNYVKVNPQSLLQIGNKFLTNGPDNDFFTTVENAYLGSSTLQAVVDGYVNYIVGDGLKAVEGITQEKLDKIISSDDLQSLVHEYKLQRNSPLQVIYNKAGDLKVTKIHSIPARQIAVDKPEDLMEDPLAYWFSFDWKLKSKFKPKLVPSFGLGEDRETELFYLKGNSPQPIFALPDYFSGLQYAQIEEEIANYLRKHIKNNFSAGKIINVNQGEAVNEEAEEDAERTFKNKLTGSNNAGEIIVSFNKDKDSATTVDSIEITDAYQQFEFISKEANSKILLANKVTSPSLFGQAVATGFSSDSEEMKTALKTLYRNQINPNRNTILTALENILKVGYPDIKLDFEDFEELREGDETPQLTDSVTGEKTDIKTTDSEVESESQAGLRGSVGGVTGILSIQQSVIAGTTGYDPAITILKEVFGFDEAVAIKLLGNKEDINKAIADKKIE